MQFVFWMRLGIMLQLRVRRIVFEADIAGITDIEGVDMKKIIATMVCVLLMLTAFFGCTAELSITDRLDAMLLAKAEIDASAVDLSAPNTLRVAEFGMDEERSEMLHHIADKYMTDQPQTTIEYIAANAESLHRDLSSGEAFDLVEVSEKSIQQLVEDELLLNLYQTVADWEEYSTLTNAARQMALLNYSKEDPSIFFLPSGIYKDVLLLRTDLLPEEVKPHELVLTVDPNNSEKGLYADCKKLVDAGIVPSAIGFQSAGGLYRFADMYMMSAVGMSEIANAYHPYYSSEHDGTTIFSLDDAKAGLIQFKRLIQDFTPEDSLRWTDEAAAEAFMNGEIAMLVADSTMIRRCEEALTDTQLQTIYFPLGESRSNVMEARFTGWAVPATTEDVDRAKDFLLFLSNSDNNTMLAKVSAAVPAHNNAIENDVYFAGRTMYSFTKMEKRMSTYTSVVPPIKYHAFSSYQMNIDDWLSDYLLDVIDEAELLHRMDEYWQEAYAAEGRLWPLPEITESSQE